MFANARYCVSNKQSLGLQKESRWSRILHLKMTNEAVDLTTVLHILQYVGCCKNNEVCILDF